VPFILRYSLLLLLLSFGCGGPPKLRVVLEAERDANQDAPIAVSVLVIYSKELLKELSRLSASEWFKQSTQRLRDNPDMVDFDLLSWELMPGQKVKEVEIELKSEDAKGLAFADYYTEGKHRVRFNPKKRILVLLGNDDFRVLNLEEE